MRCCQVEEFEGDQLKFKGEWTTASQGPRAKSGSKEDAKDFKPEKTWHKSTPRARFEDTRASARLNECVLLAWSSAEIMPPPLRARADPQFRVWLRDPETGAPVTGPVGLAITLSTPIENAEIGMHVMRNAFCQFHNEKIEVLADRYQRVVGICAHRPSNEITYELTVDENIEVKKNGCESSFPFFVVPSLMDKKMAGPLKLTVASDKSIVVQMLDDTARKQ